jgi:hypothetical protein
MMPVVGASRRRATAGSPRAAIYLRVSTEGQVDGTSIDTQRAHCQALARRHGFALAGEYVDAGVSGAASSRPGLDELVAAASGGEVDVMVVAKLDQPPTRFTTGDATAMAMYAGRGVGDINDAPSAARIIDRIMDDALPLLSHPVP